MRLHEPGDVVEGYRIERRLGQGANGTTYEATRAETGERVALKRLALAHASDWKQVDLFEREARVLSRLQHPGVPHYIAHFTVEGEGGPALYIAEELVVGRSLAELVEKPGAPMDEIQVRSLAEKMLLVLDYLGRQTPPVIHRDIKPGNILRRDDGTIALVDFGAARCDVARPGGGSTTIGTYGYMAPEQLHGEARPATDIYGLASTMLFLLTGRSPSDLPRQKLKIDLRGSVSVAPAFARWLERALEPDVEDRFPSAALALAALRRAGTGTEDDAPAAQFWKGIRQLPVALGAALFLLGGAVGLALTRKPDAPVAPPQGPHVGIRTLPAGPVPPAAGNPSLPAAPSVASFPTYPALPTYPAYPTYAAPPTYPSYPTLPTYAPPQTDGEARGTFDRGAAAGALAGVNVLVCRRPGGPSGSGHVAVTFSPDGTVSAATIDQPPFMGTEVGGCIAGRYRSVRVPPFSGSAVKVGKSFQVL